jgi:SAM-dependent methyltransferase
VDAHAFDAAIIFGVMHHLPDGKVRDLLRLAAYGLRPGGRLVTMDPCRLPDMSVVERMAVRYDRGMFIRELSEYEALVTAEFESVSHSVRAMARVPLRAAVFVCEAGSSEPTRRQAQHLD